LWRYVVVSAEFLHKLTAPQISDAFSAINDPLFFAHHAALDYIWALWQDQDPKRVQAAKDMNAARGQLRDVPLWMGVFCAAKIVSRGFGHPE